VLSSVSDKEDSYIINQNQKLSTGGFSVSWVRLNHDTLLSGATRTTEQPALQGTSRDHLVQPFVGK